MGVTRFENYASVTLCTTESAQCDLSMIQNSQHSVKAAQFLYHQHHLHDPYIITKTWSVQTCIAQGYSATCV
jgi:hypothetical protein